jgi:hypothetical protein
MKTKLPRLLLALLLLIIALPSADVSASSCEEQVYQDCLTFCYGLAQEGRCDFYASQACLCMRAPADCPVCY